MRLPIPCRVPLLLVLPFFTLSGCEHKNSPDANAGTSARISPAAEAIFTVMETFAAERSFAKARAAVIAESLDDRQLAAQVMMTGIDGRGSLKSDMRTLLEECPAGGIILFRYNLDTAPDEIRNLINECAALVTEGTVSAAAPAGIAPFVAVDHEGGSVNRFLPGGAVLPAALSYSLLAET
jgi:hypothetical protein